MKKHWRKLIFNTQVDDVRYLEPCHLIISLFHIRYWLKSTLSLTVVMGIAWLGNVLFFRKELLFIAYIMTVFIAAQGIIIFILYVPLSSHVRITSIHSFIHSFIIQVRAAYSKSWNDKRANTNYFSAMLLKRASLASTRIRNITNISQSVGYICTWSQVYFNDYNRLLIKAVQLQVAVFLWPTASLFAFLMIQVSSFIC